MLAALAGGCSRESKSGIGMEADSVTAEGRRGSDSKALPEESDGRGVRMTDDSMPHQAVARDSSGRRALPVEAAERGQPPTGSKKQ
jgi:hypothetical protein